MNKEIVIIGAGFAGMWAALSAARLAKLQGVENIQVTVIAPVAELRVRPRFYEANAGSMVSPLMPVFDVMGVSFVTGKVSDIDLKNKIVHFVDGSNTKSKQYDRLVLAAGSNLRTDLVKGTAEHAFDLDQIESAIVLDQHINIIKCP